MSSRNGNGPAPTARISWGEDGTPRSARFDDVYFSRTDGLAESRYVFLEGNELPARFTALRDADRFLIGETGFGTGLNFLASWALWMRTAPAGARLEYVSAEAFPVARADMEKALARWDVLHPFSEQLLAQYPRCFHRGAHRLELLPGRVSLTLLVGDALEQFEGCLQSTHPAHRRFEPGIDAWFLDGFSPSRNPELWRSELFCLIQQLSKPGSTAATFSAAGAVRRGLAAAGFSVRRAPGHGHKRNMTRARLVKAHARPPVTRFKDSVRPQQLLDTEPEKASAMGAETAGDSQRTARRLPLAWDVAEQTSVHPPGPVLIIGAGLAGCHAARALAERGCTVTLVDRHAAVAGEGSGNRQGVLYAKPAAQGGVASDFNLSALQFAQRHYRRFITDPACGELCGVLHLATSAKESERHAALLERWPGQRLFGGVSAFEASARAGIALEHGGLTFPDSGWLSPPRICLSLIDHPSIRFLQGSVASLLREGNLWRALDATGKTLASAPVAVMACALGLETFEQTAGLPVQAVRGQVSTVRCAPDSPGKQLKMALCADGYVAPAFAGEITFGASFVPNQRETTLRNDEHAQNLERIRRQIPGLVSDETGADDCAGRAALRCATPDRLPMVGPIPDGPAMDQRFALLGKNAEAQLNGAGAVIPGLFVSAGYGSKGLAYAPLATELLCWHILGGVPPMQHQLRRALHPARFLIRDIIRQKRRGRARP